MTILTPLDGSPFAERALPWACQLTEGDAATLVLVRAVVPHEQRGAAPVAADQTARGEAERYLRDVAQRLFPGGRVETTVYAGAADAAILDATRRHRADLLIMATHTRPPLAGLLYGSVARALLAGSPVPILLIRSGSPDAAVAPGDSPSRVLVALDGSPFGEEALPPALAIAQALHAALTLVRVAPPPERLLSGTLGLLLAATEPDQSECVAEAERYLDGVRRQIASLAPFQIVQTEVRVGDPQRAIVDAERDRAATTVVMATHGRSGWGHVLLGSVAEGVLRAGTVPVLFVRPGTLRPGPGDADHVAMTDERPATPIVRRSTQCRTDNLTP